MIAAESTSRRVGVLNELQVLVETQPDTDPASPAAQATARQLQHDIKAYIGSSASIELKAAGGVERSAGKARRVIDLRK